MSAAVVGRSDLPRATVVRRALASAASIAQAALLFYAFFWTKRGDTHGAMWVAQIILVAAPVAAAAAIWTRYLSLQLLARAYWWAQLLFGCLLSVVVFADKGIAALAVGSACALLSAGRLGLDETSGGRFRPVAFRGTLMLALVLAMADAGSFSWLGFVQMTGGGKLRLILFAPPMLAAVIGLLRLRTWGLLLSFISNLLVAVLAGARLLDLPEELRWLFVGMAIVQLLIPLPMWITIIRRRPAPPDRWRRAKAIASTGVILVLVAICVGAMAFRPAFRFID